METSLSAGITALVKQGHCTMLQLIEKMSTKPAQLLGIPAGTLKKGSPADVILIDKDEEWTVDVDKLHGKSKNCVFKNRKLTGKVNGETIIFERKAGGLWVTAIPRVKIYGMRRKNCI